MSFVDLATLTLHRRHEMEGRISTFTSKCDTAINNIRKLKAQARTFVDKLNCEPSELKERFLTSMMKLDEYIYLMTEFNLSIENLEKNGSMELAPVHDNSYKNYPVMIPTNLMDVLSEPAPTPSTASANRCPVEKPQPRRRPRAQELILFSSTSCSAESVPEANTTVEKEVQCVEQEIQELTITDPTVIELPAQDTLDTGKVYDATIMSVDGSSLWIVTEPFDNVFNFLQEMTTYYEREENQVKLPVSSMPDCSYCAYFDAQDTQWYLRALLIKTTESGPLLFLVDTGEMRPVAGACLRLAAPHAARPPLARLCHLADVDLLSSLNKEGVEDYLKQFVGKPYTMKVDDNSSESLGVFVFVDGDATLNERLVQEGLATALDKPSKLEEELHLPTHGPPELAESADDEYGPEHDDPVEAVAGYSNRDEIDICKHYVGGPDKTCFKGLRCKKRHVLKHPDGWTLDRVAVPGKCRSLPLPAPGTWHKVVVTYVCHFDRLYVHFEQEKAREELPSFGVVLPPMTLDSLVRDMNSPATYAAFTPLQMAPAPGELVAAKYRDGLWYRARVTCATRADQCVEVIYIDYGNVISVKENEIMVLDRRFVALPAQAVLCRLAGVSKLADDSRQWAAAKARLTQLAQDQPMQAHIIARGYDELTVEMFDAEGHSLAQRLAEGGEVAYRRDYDVEDDTQVRFKMVQP